MNATLIQFMKTTFATRVFERRLIEPHPAFSDVVESQASIGWMQIFHGFWSPSSI
jgi:hypothetical protein